ncbi:Coenzyme F420 hydrogenase/dehydrogenase, beta subunit C-terminal domain [uncultured Butyricimonas sp.]|uniref:Coenzyme F420 hydrogenase/dehydrogenase, beta subunit C-terminal domain n=1 Tax=uncultured Butyricimonas sp. TaxID=1268785 RepID=UPI0026DD9289|nr:Coenzyme F420 hydrogenase/dehydrogenase, beta subunit C-terminal domain [uncultured Butyricimonas sp.]
MKNICSPINCSGCFACFNVCPRTAITMQSDSYGFLYPVIDVDKCIDCGLCVKVCPANKVIKGNHIIRALAVILKAPEALLESASGGAASAIACGILEQGGIVYGCSSVDNCFDVRHVRINGIDSISKIRGSKYVQSLINNTFADVKKDLSDGYIVGYFGTPCQIAGLKSFLKFDYKNLFTIDLVCHGVSSVKFLKDAVDEYNKKYVFDKQNLKVKFREKRSGTIKYGLFIQDLTNMSYRQRFVNPKDAFTMGFLKGYTIRESCFSCKYTNIYRQGDFTVGDYWGLGKTQLNRDNGVSLLLINTSKANILFNQIQKFLYCEERSIENAVKGNGRFRYPLSKPKLYEEFHQQYLKIGWKAISKYRLKYKMQYYKAQIRPALANITMLRMLYLFFVKYFGNK